MRGRRRLVRALAWAAVSLVAAALTVVAAGVIVIRSSWGRDRIRQLIVSQANRFLTGTLEIERVDGSILGGIVLERVRLVQDGTPVITIDKATIGYGIRELYEGGTRIRSLRLERLQVVGARDADGRWNLGRLVRPRPPRPNNGNPPRLLAFPDIELVDSRVEFRDPLMLGAARLPSQFDDLDTRLAFEWRGPAWSATFADASWIGREPELTMRHLTGGVATDGSNWTFTDLHVETPRSVYTVNGGLRRQPAPTQLELAVTADRFAFQEWGGVLGGLRNIAVEASFTVALQGPLNQLATTVDLRSTGGNVEGTMVLDSSVPGWHGSGAVAVARLDVSRWFNRPDRPSDITGRVEFDLDLDLGRHFPRGRYAFDGSHAAYAGYAADNVRARGTLTADEAVIAAATATAYGADVRVESGAIAIDAPYRYRFAGRAAGVDLRRLPPTVPMPHVESTLSLDYQVHGQFTPGTLVGNAVFAPSEFLGAAIGAGTRGSVDTTGPLVRYAGDGTMTGIDLNRFGAGLDIAWMNDPRYAGTIDGDFAVDGSGSEAATMTLEGGGRLTRAALFDGALTDADVSVRIADGALRGSYDGRLANINPARALGDPRWQASLTGAGRAEFAIDGLLTRTTTLADYTVDGQVAFADSSIRTFAFDRIGATGRLANETLTLSAVDVAGPSLTGLGSGTIELDGERSSAFDYAVAQAELPLLLPANIGAVGGQLTTKGHLSGPWNALHLVGDAQVTRLTGSRLEVLSGSLSYDVTVPPAQPRQTAGRISGSLGPLTVAGQAVNEVSLTALVDGDRISLDVNATRAGGLNGALTTAFRLDPERRTLDVSRLELRVGEVTWETAAGSAPHFAWDDDGVTIADLAITDRVSTEQRLTIAGDWRPAAGGRLRVQADGIYLDGLVGVLSQPPRYAGRFDADAVIRPADAGGRPVVTGHFTITEGRVRRLGYDRLEAQIDYDKGLLTVDARLDQAPGVWLTAAGRVPLALFVDGQPDLPMQLAVTSSPIDLGIVEGLTDRVREVSGGLQIDVRAIGTANDPHFDGSVAITDGGFLVVATGARYQRTRLDVALSSDQVTVRALHVEDSRGRALDVTGSLGTHELRVGDLAITARARQFEVMRNQFGSTEVDADLDLGGEFESPRLTGSIAITGGDLNVDEILDRVLLRPYSTVAAPAASTGDLFEIDPLEVLNPWQRMGINLSVASRGTLHMVGENVQVSAGTPLGFGNVNIRAFGEVYLYKDPAAPLFVTGAFDSLIGTYSFQGRRFDLDPTSSIVFRGDLNPELYVTVQRTISSVETRVSIVGPLDQPELRLSSVPPLDDSNILSLIVFNTTINELNGTQQQELAVRAGTLAAGFLATPIVTALERSLGLDILEIELQPSGVASSSAPAPRVTVGDEIAPGLIARFSRQFGQQEYSEASIEYFLSRLFRIRATFSDAGSLLARSPFRRVERAGIDFLVFFSF